MRTLRGGAKKLLSLPAVLMLAAVLTAVSSAPVSASGRGGGTGGCDPYVDGTVIPVPCSSGSGGGGGTGGGATTVNNSCTAIALSKSQAENLGLSWPPPAGETWALLECLGGAMGAGPQAVLVKTATGNPAVTPQQLLVTALGELQIPHLGPSTAPPRGSDGLVGLPEWFWIPAGDWHARTVTVTAGPVWAAVTAVPVGLAFQPGGHLSSVRCTGPGTAYNPHKPAGTQRTGCSYTYLQPSTGQPANAYRASVTVTWRVSWVGSGGAGGLLSAALPVSVAISIPVAQGEALVTSP
jgi:hypothetical protein